MIFRNDIMEKKKKLPFLFIANLHRQSLIKYQIEITTQFKQQINVIVHRSFGTFLF